MRPANQCSNCYHCGREESKRRCLVCSAKNQWESIINNCDNCKYEMLSSIQPPCNECNYPDFSNWKSKTAVENNCTTCCYAGLNISCIPCMQKALTVGEYPNWAALKFNGVENQIRQAETERVKVYWDSEKHCFELSSVHRVLKTPSLTFVQEVTYTHEVQI
jgi:hypothetical protein